MFSLITTYPARCAVPAGVKHTGKDLATARRDGQVRLRWDGTPIDIFLNTTGFHSAVAEGIRWETFMGRPVPFLCCSDLAVFKAFFNRTRDRADLEEMQAAGTLNIEQVSAVLIRYLGTDDERVSRLTQMQSR